MTKFHHIGLWTADLERLKDFYVRYFGAQPGPKYINPSKGFYSYFLSFEGGSQIEMMSQSSLELASRNCSLPTRGFAHFALEVGSVNAVNSLTEQLRLDGYQVLVEPRRTGDGYYESHVLDPDLNRLEIVHKL